MNESSRLRTGKPSEFEAGGPIVWKPADLDPRVDEWLRAATNCGDPKLHVRALCEQIRFRAELALFFVLGEELQSRLRRPRRPGELPPVIECMEEIARELQDESATEFLAHRREQPMQRFEGRNAPAPPPPERPAAFVTSTALAALRFVREFGDVQSLAALSPHAARMLAGALTALDLALDLDRLSIGASSKRGAFDAGRLRKADRKGRPSALSPDSLAQLADAARVLWRGNPRLSARQVAAKLRTRLGLEVSEDTIARKISHLRPTGRPSQT
jgi:hypothetical protein